jgi:hypothetical protein
MKPGECGARSQHSHGLIGGASCPQTGGKGKARRGGRGILTHDQLVVGGVRAMQVRKPGSRDSRESGSEGVAHADELAVVCRKGGRSAWLAI